MYIFIDENTVIAYSGEILKRYVDNRLVKAISNPTKANLKEFGYMELVKSDKAPEYNSDTQHLATKYKIVDEKIVEYFVVEENTIE